MPGTVSCSLVPPKVGLAIEPNHLLVSGILLRVAEPIELFRYFWYSLCVVILCSQLYSTTFGGFLESAFCVLSTKKGTAPKFILRQPLKNAAGANAFTLSPTKWIESTNAIRIFYFNDIFGRNNFVELLQKH
jgi:hypothetical protein